MISKNHYFNNLTPSPWPLIQSIQVFALFLSLCYLFKSGSLNLTLVSLLILAPTSLRWWKFYGEEINLAGNYTKATEARIKSSIILFITSEVLLFVSLFWSHLHHSSVPSCNLRFLWPSPLLQVLELDKGPLLGTLILMTSGATITASHHNFTKEKTKISTFMLLLTIVLGVFFSIVQYIEYTGSFFGFSDTVYGSSFYIITGFHGAHVVVGFAFLTYAIVSLVKNTETSQEAFSFEISSWYWHFVDVVWLFVFYFLYYLPM